MGNSLSKIFTVFLAVVLLFIYPMLQMLEQQDVTTRDFVFTQTTLFVDTVRNTGILTPEMYEEFLNKLDATGHIYEVKLEHNHNTYFPVYLDPADPSTFTGEYIEGFLAYYTDDITSVLQNSGPYNTYYMNSSDQFVVSVVNKDQTLYTKIKNWIYGIDVETSIIVRYGGCIK